MGGIVAVKLHDRHPGIEDLVLVVDVVERGEAVVGVQNRVGQHGDVRAAFDDGCKVPVHILTAKDIRRLDQYAVACRRAERDQFVPDQGLLALRPGLPGQKRHAVDGEGRGGQRRIGLVHGREPVGESRPALVFLFHLAVGRFRSAVTEERHVLALPHLFKVVDQPVDRRGLFRVGGRSVGGIVDQRLAVVVAEPRVVFHQEPVVGVPPADDIGEVVDDKVLVVQTRVAVPGGEQTGTVVDLHFDPGHRRHRSEEGSSFHTQNVVEPVDDDPHLHAPLRRLFQRLGKARRALALAELVGDEGDRLGRRVDQFQAPVERVLVLLDDRRPLHPRRTVAAVGRGIARARRGPLERKERNGHTDDEIDEVDQK